MGIIKTLGGSAAVIAMLSGDPAVAQEKPAHSPINIVEIQEGDTLWGISTKYCGTPSKVKAIAELNKINNPNHIHAGGWRLEHIVLPSDCNPQYLKVCDSDSQGPNTVIDYDLHFLLKRHIPGLDYTVRTGVLVFKDGQQPPDGLSFQIFGKPNVSGMSHLNFSGNGALPGMQLIDICYEKAPQNPMEIIK